jgi:ferredoxin--NADP+ reductase
MSTTDEKFYRPRITQRVDFAPDLWMIRIDPGGEFKFAPGQYATLGVEGPQKRSERPYSIVSSPYENEMEFFFELVPEGDLTPQLYKLQRGDELLMRKVAKGRFTLDTMSWRTHHLLVCTVTGIAPFVSYVRTLYQDWKEGKFAGRHKLFLLTGASRSWEFGYYGEIQEYARQVPWLEAVPTVSRPWEDEKWKGETGRVEDILRKYADMWGTTRENCVAYLCGHPEMIEHCKEILKRCSYPKEAIKEEVYWMPAKKAAA